MKCSLYFLLISGLLLFHYAHAQSQAEINRSKEIIRIKQELQTSKFDTNRANLLLKLALVYLYKPDEQASDLDTTLKLIRQVYSISRYFHYSKGLGKAYLYAAQAHREKGDTKQSRKFAQTALSIFNRIRATAEKADAHLELSRSYSIRQEDLQIRIQNHEKALFIYQQTGKKEAEASALKELGEFENLRGFRTKALIYLK